MLISSKITRPQGLATFTDPDGLTEFDTYTCGHCQFITLVPAKADPTLMGGLCKICMRLVCSKCADKGYCEPWEKAMEKQEARDAAIRSYEL